MSHLPVFLLTGFLGSGKTSLIQRLLRHPDFIDSAVLVNEFGEIGLDHDLVNFSSERTVVLNGGCVCCSIRQDLESALAQLLEQRDKGEIPAFARIIIETTGLADPVPIISTLVSNPLAMTRLRLFATITAVDVLLGPGNLDSYDEARKQVAAADWLIITKCDSADEAMIDALEHRLRRTNPWARIERLSPVQGDITIPFRVDAHDPDTMRPDAWVTGRVTYVGSPVLAPCEQHHHGHHAESFGSFSIIADRPLDWSMFGIWLTLLLHRHGQHILRVKGLLNVSGLPGPVLLHAVQHIVYQPIHLREWPDADQRSRIVLIMRGIRPSAVRRSFELFSLLAESAGGRNTQLQYKPAGAGGTVAGRPIRRATAPRWLRG